MKRTSVATLIVLILGGAILGGLLKVAAAAFGGSLSLPVVLGVGLGLIGVIVVLLAIPIRRHARGRAPRPVDPYYATRVLVLAKACALAGALLAGGGIGITVYLVTQLDSPTGGSIGSAVALIIGAGVLLAGGLIAEYMCTVPPGDDDDDDEDGKKTVRVRP